uniref:Uncharacterized protein n=1 Tax=Anopheles atroparvus TaxID=41427 RepID=A0AAG5CSZ2_ANOAO
MMNHHTIPKLGFGPYKSSTSGVGSFFLPKILTHPTDRSCAGGKVALELTHGNSKQATPEPPHPSSSSSSSSPTSASHPILMPKITLNPHTADSDSRSTSIQPRFFASSNSSRSSPTRNHNLMGHSRSPVLFPQ